MIQANTDNDNYDLIFSMCASLWHCFIAVEDKKLILLCRQFVKKERLRYPREKGVQRNTKEGSRRRGVPEPVTTFAQPPRTRPGQSFALIGRYQQLATPSSIQTIRARL